MIRDRLSSLLADLRDMTSTVALVLVVTAGVVGMVTLWQGCVSGRAPLQMLQERNER